MTTSNGSTRLEKVGNETLFVSEPPPDWFGNPPNESSRHHEWTNKNWLKSRFHFSFAEYHDAARSQYGVLRVMNDDLVQPARGFGTHPHRDMEIVTYIVSGSLSHRDSMGTDETLGPGSIQFMTAGTGVRHSEHNRDAAKDLRFIQMWITPRSYSLPPNYGSMPVDAKNGDGPESERDGWAHLVSDTKNESTPTTPVKINQDANIFVSRLSPGASASLTIAPSRQAYMLCLDGCASVKLDGESVQLVRHDALRVGPAISKHDRTPGIDAAQLVCTAAISEEINKGGAHLLVVEMAASD